MKKVLDLFGNEIIVGPKPNPMLLRVGNGPEGKKCKHCKHLFSKHFSKIYYKCALRGDTNGAGTDHRVNWPACKMFEPSDDDQKLLSRR